MFSFVIIIHEDYDFAEVLFTNEVHFILLPERDPEHINNI